MVDVKLKHNKGDAMSLTSAARKIGLSRQTLKRRIDAGEGPKCFKIPGNPARPTYRIWPDDFQKWLDQGA